MTVLKYNMKRVKSILIYKSIADDRVFPKKNCKNDHHAGEAFYRSKKPFYPCKG